jgi:hypothetical protein
MSRYGAQEISSGIQALFNSLNLTHGNPDECEDIFGYLERHAKTMELVAHGYPQAIRDIEPEYGFHFERGEHVKAHERYRRNAGGSGVDG